MGKRGRHNNLSKEIKPSVLWIESLAFVKKVILGPCEAARHSFTPGFIRFQMDWLGGLKLIAYTGNGVMKLFIQIEDKYKPELIQLIKNRWPN